MPDIALLDIDLEGEQTGIDLGKILSTNYNIPFIYVTDYDDSETFFEGLKKRGWKQRVLNKREGLTLYGFKR